MDLQQPPFVEGSPVNRHAPRSVAPAHRRTMIAEAAYFIAEHRGFSPGCELDDWLEAEREVDRVLFDVSRLPERP
ncbi:MAG TPA: DUF2934 domain-containing protein [Candidatus Dormibacteraeota bacterium]|nr:DUF2934 domain-containing protein [Candidatus Dormibacteraeota bacterium]